MKSKKRTIYALVLILGIFISIYVVSGTTSFDWALDPNSIVAKGTTFVSKLLCLLLLATPPIVLAFIIFGGIYYLLSADDPAKRRVAKNIIIDGIIGGVCVIALIAIASYLGIPVDPTCFGGGGGGRGGGPYSPFLQSPPYGGTLP